MKESIEFLILDTIKKHSSIMPLFTAGYSYSKVIEWVNILEEYGEICYDETERRILSDIGMNRWNIMKNKKNVFTILPLNSYKVEQINIDEIYLP